MSATLANRLSLDLAVNPVPKARARRGKDDRFYTPERTAAFEELCGWAMRTAVRRPFDGELVVRLRFWRNHRSRTARAGDGDNLVKAVFDAGNTILWHDDSQIRQHSAELVAQGPDVEGRITIDMHAYAPDLDGPAAWSRYIESLARLRSVSDKSLGDVAGAAAGDQYACGVREFLGLAGLDVDDPAVERVLVRTLDMVVVTAITNRIAPGVALDRAIAGARVLADEARGRP